MFAAISCYIVVSIIKHGVFFISIKHGIFLLALLNMVFCCCHY